MTYRTNEKRKIETKSHFRPHCIGIFQQKDNVYVNLSHRVLNGLFCRAKVNIRQDSDKILPHLTENSSHLTKCPSGFQMLLPYVPPGFGIFLQEEKLQLPSHVLHLRTNWLPWQMTPWLPSLATPAQPKRQRMLSCTMAVVQQSSRKCSQSSGLAHSRQKHVILAL